jgi:hypothetical protein
MSSTARKLSQPSQVECGEYFGPDEPPSFSATTLAFSGANRTAIVPVETTSPPRLGDDNISLLGDFGAIAGMLNLPAAMSLTSAPAPRPKMDEFAPTITALLNLSACLHTASPMPCGGWLGQDIVTPTYFPLIPFVTLSL